MWKLIQDQGNRARVVFVANGDSGRVQLARLSSPGVYVDLERGLRLPFKVTHFKDVEAPAFCRPEMEIGKPVIREPVIGKLAIREPLIREPVNREPTVMPESSSKGSKKPGRKKAPIGDAG
jgi:hypothetical protein